MDSATHKVYSYVTRVKSYLHLYLLHAVTPLLNVGTGNRPAIDLLRYSRMVENTASSCDRCVRA